MRSAAVKLALLGRFHYVVAALIAILGNVPAIVLWFQWQKMQEDPDLILPWMGPVMAIIGIGLLVDGWIMGALLALAGFLVRRRKNRTYCLVVAALSIPHVPFATILGVFSLVTLRRPEVKALFESPPSPPAAAV
jgi:hypothetical protein